MDDMWACSPLNPRERALNDDAGWEPANGATLILYAHGRADGREYDLQTPGSAAMAGGGYGGDLDSTASAACMTCVKGGEGIPACAPTASAFAFPKEDSDSGSFDEDNTCPNCGETKGPKGTWCWSAACKSRREALGNGGTVTSLHPGELGGSGGGVGFGAQLGAVANRQPVAAAKRQSQQQLEMAATYAHTQLQLQLLQQKKDELQEISNQILEGFLKAMSVDTLLMQGLLQRKATLEGEIAMLVTRES